MTFFDLMLRVGTATDAFVDAIKRLACYKLALTLSNRKSCEKAKAHLQRRNQLLKTLFLMLFVGHSVVTASKFTRYDSLTRLEKAAEVLPPENRAKLVKIAENIRREFLIGRGSSPLHSDKCGPKCEENAAAFNARIDSLIYKLKQ